METSSLLKLHPPGASTHVVLLGIDGTLVDSNDAHARAWVGSLAEHGYVVQFEDVRRLIGKGGDKLMPELTGLDPESDQATAMSALRAELFARELPSLRPTRGARDLLVALRDRGLQLVVATSAMEEEVTVLLQQAGVADLIEAASSSDDAEASKPDPDIIQAALRKVGRQAAHSVMLGDTPYDVEAAQRARVPTIALRCGGWWGDDAFSNAVGIYDDPAHLLAGLADSPLAQVGTVAR
jgi:HAD superfamily hydrolase (TIGR01549 family)